MREHRNGSDRRSGRPPAADLAREEPALLAMQRTAGNQAVAQMLSVQRSATTELGTWDAEPVESYEIGLNAVTPDVVGHAWIDLKEVGGKERKRSVGFWPASLWAASPIGGPGELMSPDGHQNDTNARHRQRETITRDKFLQVLSVVRAWEGSWYQLLYRNCAHFARIAWMAGTGHPDAITRESGPEIWTPGETGDIIDQVNKAKGLDAQGNPVKRD